MATQPASRHDTSVRLLLIAAWGLSACSGSWSHKGSLAPPPPSVRSVADGLYRHLLQSRPLQAFVTGSPDASLVEVGDNSLAGERRRQLEEDRLLEELRAIDVAGLRQENERALHSILLEHLQAAVAGRVCQDELWRVTQTSGPQQLPVLLASLQPVGTPERRSAALARFSRLAPYLDTEIANLREGVRLGLTAPAGNVRAVIEQLDGLLASAPEASPLFILAKRDGTAAFASAVLALIRDRLSPALTRYRHYLATEYLPRARSGVAIADLPQGASCDRSRLRAFTTLPLTAEEVHRWGLEEGARIRQKMEVLARTSFGSTDLRALFDRFRTEPAFRFQDRDEALRSAQAILTRVKATLPRWFVRLPRAEMVLDPCLPFEEKSGCPNSYLPAAQDGSRPGRWRINLSPERSSRLEVEVMAFHEGYPGHHLQVALAQERGEAHPVTRLLTNAGFAEGWGLYAEELADEMGLYSTDAARLARLSSAAFRAARLVVDPGLHVLGWSRERAIDYLLANTVISPQSGSAEVDRYIINPGQATAYMVGRLEIDGLRRKARSQLGARFDVRTFHDRLLEQGAVPLGYLRSHIDSWLQEQTLARR